jgi:hypothetical protein
MKNRAAKDEPLYTKTQLLRGREWSSREREQLMALLADEGSYSVQQAKRMIQTFANRRVE